MITNNLQPFKLLLFSAEKKIQKAFKIQFQKNLLKEINRANIRGA